MAGYNVIEILTEPTAAAISHAITEIKESKKLGKGIKYKKIICAYVDLGGGTFDLSLVQMITFVKSDPAEISHNIKIQMIDGDSTLGCND